MLLRYPLQPLAAAGVRIRAWRSPDDLACVEAAATDPDIPAGTSVPRVFTEAAGTAFLARQHARLTDGDGVSQAVTDATSGQAVGLIYLDRRPQPWIAGLGYWLIPGARGRHLAAPAIRLVTDWALRELEVLRVEAWVARTTCPPSGCCSTPGSSSRDASATSCSCRAGPGTAWCSPGSLRPDRL